MSAYTMAVVAMIDVSSYYASESIADNVCASAGRSVLSEYQDELFRRYGIFLLRNSEKIFETKADLYINSSLRAKKGTVRFGAAAADIDMALWPGTSVPELKRQIRKVSPLGVNEYILSNFSCYTETMKNTYQRYEVEKIICGEKTDEENYMEIRRKLTALRFAINMATANKEDFDVAAIGTFIEAVIPGNLEDAAVETAQALEQAKRDVDVLMGGGYVPITGTSENYCKYKDYLRILLVFVPEDVKFYRMMRIMETNIRMVDAVIFSFSDYVYGFDMKVALKRRSLSDFLGFSGRVKIVSFHFSYK